MISRLHLSCCVSILCASLLCADEIAPSKPPVGTDVDTLFARLKEDPPISQRDLTKELSRLGSSAVPHILQYLNGTPDESALRAAFEAILETDDKNTVSHLISLLDADSKAVQIAAINALGRIVTPETITALTKIMMETQDSDLFKPAQAGIIAILRSEKVSGTTFAVLTAIAEEGRKIEKIRIIHCLGASGNRRAGHVLIGFLEDPEMSVTVAAIAALGTLKVSDHRISFRLRRFLDEPNPYIRKEAALALGKLRDIESIHDLINLLDDAHPGVIDTAHWALKQISGKRFSKSSVYWDTWWQDEEEKYQTELDDLLGQIHGEVTGRRVMAIRGLSRMVLGREEIADNLLQLTSDNNPMIRGEACAALGIMKISQAVPDLIACLDDTNNDAKSRAHRALQQITNQDLPAVRDDWEKWQSSQ